MASPQEAKGIRRAAREQEVGGIAGYSTVHAAGEDNDQSWASMVGGRTGLKPNDLDWCDLGCWIGEVAGVDQVSLPPNLAAWDCRIHRLAWMAMQRNGFAHAVNDAIERYGRERVAVVLGTSTSGIRSTELAYSHWKASGRWPADYDYRHVHSLDALCRFVALALDVAGPMVTISTACSSSAKVFLTAQRWIDCGLVDAAVVGGADSLCLSTLCGFDSLQLLSSDICRPFDAARNGLSIGEAAGFVLLDRHAARIDFLGGGESSDAWHMSSPQPEGLGAQAAMRAALRCAGLTVADIGYVNAHGTATAANDRAEAAAIRAVFGAHDVPVSSTKGVTGHALGAAGITEAIVAIQALERQVLPPSSNLRERDPGLALDVIEQARAVPIRRAMSNSFGFGGNNCALIFGRTD